MDTSDEWIRTQTGIVERRIAAENESTADMAYRAAQAALDASGIYPEELDMILVATATPDRSFPSVACVLQEKIGAKHCAAIDISAACSGFIYRNSDRRRTILRIRCIPLCPRCRCGKTLEN